MREPGGRSEALSAASASSDRASACGVTFEESCLLRDSELRGKKPEVSRRIPEVRRLSAPHALSDGERSADGHLFRGSLEAQNDVR